MERDYQADLDVCIESTPGPWEARPIMDISGPMRIPIARAWEVHGFGEDDTLIMDWVDKKEDAEFIALSREALPYYIERCMALEHDVECGKQAIQELEIHVGQMRKALEIIANPIKYLREVAEKQGGRIDCNVTFKLADSANYLSGIAEIALQTPAPARREAIGIVFPCNIGDTVYTIINHDKNVQPIVVHGWRYSQHDAGWVMLVSGMTANMQHRCTPHCSLNSFGKNIFLTRAEADNALEALSELTQTCKKLSASDGRVIGLLPIIDKADDALAALEGGGE